MTLTESKVTLKDKFSEVDEILDEWTLLDEEPDFEVPKLSPASEQRKKSENKNMLEILEMIHSDNPKQPNKEPAIETPLSHHQKRLKELESEIQKLPPKFSEKRVDYLFEQYRGLSLVHLTKFARL